MFKLVFFSELANKLGISSRQDNSELIKDVVALYKGKKLLFILDNIDSCEIINDFINAQNKNVFLVVTSQNTEMTNGFFSHNLEPLTEESSIQVSQAMKLRLPIVIAISVY